MAIQTEGSKPNGSEEPPETEITATVAQNEFGDLVGRILHKGERFLITRHGKKVARLIPIEKEVATTA